MTPSTYSSDKKSLNQMDDLVVLFWQSLHPIDGNHNIPSFPSSVVNLHGTLKNQLLVRQIRRCANVFRRILSALAILFANLRHLQRVYTFHHLDFVPSSSS